MYDAYLAGLAKVKGADIASNELKFLTDVMNGQDLSLADFIEEGRHLKGAVSYRLYDEEETYNEKWHVDVKQLYDKLKSLPMDALSALSVRVQLFWFEGRLTGKILWRHRTHLRTECGRTGSGHHSGTGGVLRPEIWE